MTASPDPSPPAAGRADGPGLSDLRARLAAAEGPVWITVGTLLDGSSRAPWRDAHLVYDTGAIRHVGGPDHPPPRECLGPGRSEPHLRLPGWTVLPGLVDAHAHLVLEGGETDPEHRRRHLRQSPPALLDDARRRARRLVGLGVTAVRDAGDNKGVGLTLSRECRRAAAPGAAAPPLPWIESPGPALHHRGSYGAFVGEAIEDHRSLVDCVASRVHSGAQRIKLLVSGVIDFELGRVDVPPQMSAEEVAALAGAARARGRPVFAHASGPEGIGHALAGEIESVEHGYFVTHEQLTRMRDRRIAWVPTFAPVQAQIDHAGALGWRTPVIDQLRRILDDHARSLVHAAAIGVTVLAGSDAGSYGVPHGRGLLRELALMERAGMGSLDVLSAATGTSADHLELGEGWGRLRPGRGARFILTERSPLETVAHLDRDAVVVFDGQPVDPPDPSRPGL